MLDVLVIAGAAMFGAMGLAGLRGAAATRGSELFGALQGAVAAVFLAEATMLAAAFATNATVAQITSANAGVFAVAFAVAFTVGRAFLPGVPWPLRAAALLIGVGLLAGLNDWVFDQVIARVAMAATGMVLLAVGVSLAVERPAFSWSALRAARLPSATSSGPLRFHYEVFNGPPRPGDRLDEETTDAETPSDPGTNAADTLVAALPWQLVAPVVMCAGLLFLAAGVPSPAEATADGLVKEVLATWEVVLLGLGVVVVLAEFLRGRVLQGLFGGVGLAVFVAIAGWPM